MRRKCTFAFVTGLIFGAGTFERKIGLFLNVLVLMTSFMSWSKSWNTSEKIIITKQTNKYSKNNHLCCLLVCQIQYNKYNNYITCWYSKTKNSKKYLFLPIGLVILHTACMLSALASCGAESWKPSAVGRAWLHNITQLHAVQH